MSAEQLTAFWAAVEGDPSLEETLKGAADLDAAVAVAKEAGFDVSKADLLEYQSQQTLELSDEDLEKVAGGTYTPDSRLRLSRLVDRQQAAEKYDFIINDI